MFGKSRKLPKGSRGRLPPIGIFSLEADNRAISRVSPEEIAEAWAKYDEILIQKFDETVQLELPFAEATAEPVV